MTTTSAQPAIPHPRAPQPGTLLYASLRHMMTSVLGALADDPRGTPEDHEAQREAATALLGALQPTDPVQHMLAAHTAVAHFTALDLFRRAGLPGRADAESSRLVKAANAMVTLTTRSLDRLRRCQAAKADDRHPLNKGLTEAIMKSSHKDPMPKDPMPRDPITGEQPTSDQARQSAAAEPATNPAEPLNVTPDHPAPASARTAPPPQASGPRRGNRRNNPMPGEPRTAPPSATAFPFDRQAWLAAVRMMSPQEQYALANSIQALRNEPPLPLSPLPVAV